MIKTNPFSYLCFVKAPSAKAEAHNICIDRPFHRITACVCLKEEELDRDADPLLIYVKVQERITVQFLEPVNVKLKRKDPNMTL